MPALDIPQLEKNLTPYAKPYTGSFGNICQPYLTIRPIHPIRLSVAFAAFVCAPVQHSNCNIHTNGVQIAR